MTDMNAQRYNKKHYFFFLLINALLLANSVLYAQDFNWVVPFQSGFDDKATDIVTDSNGNTYTVGIFKNSADFDPGPNVYNLNETRSDKGNLFCVKLSPAGNLIWAHQIGGDFGVSVGATNVENIHPKIAIDGSNNIYITGLYDHNVDFDPNPSNTYYIPNPTLASSTYHFVSKLSSNGNLIWAKQVGYDGNGILSSIFRNIEVDINGNIFLYGHFRDTVDFDPGPNTFNLSTDFNSDDIFFMRLDTNGNFVWAKQVGGFGTIDNAKDMSIDDQFLYITGFYRDLVDFDPDPNMVHNLQAVNNGADAFIAKYDLANGNFVWAKSIGSGNGSDIGYTIVPDNAGNVYASGSYRGTIDFDSDPNTTFSMTAIGSSSIYLLKLDNAGDFLWAKNFGAVSGSSGSSERPNNLAVNSVNSIYLSGYFLNQMDCDPDETADFDIVSNGNRDMFIINLDSSGDFIWADNFGGSQDEFTYEIITDVNDKILYAGEFRSTVDFNPNSGNSITANSPGFDAFILKLDGAILNVNEYDIVEATTIHPNPTSSLFQINTQSKILKVEIYDVNGKLILTKNMNHSSNTIDTNNWKTGVYFVKISSNSKNTVKKIIKI